MLREIRVVSHAVERGRIVFRECGMGVLTMKTLLESIDPRWLS